MQKVVFKLTRVANNGNTVIRGIGYIHDKDLIAAQVSKGNKPYVKIYANALANVVSVPSETTPEYIGSFIETFNKDGTPRRCEYLIWYRILED